MAEDLKVVEQIPVDEGAFVESWTGQTGFDYNDIASWEIVSSDFDSITEMSLVIVCKPDDGQPAADQTLASIFEATDGLRAWHLSLLTTGKIIFYGSSDGSANNESEITDSAFYADGAQSSYSMIIVTYDGSTITIDGNGSLLASTAGAGGVPASLRISGDKLTVAGLSDGSGLFNGDILLVLPFNRALTASERQRLYSSFKGYLN